MKTYLLVTTLFMSLSINAGECSKQVQTDDFDSPIAYMDDSNDELVYGESDTYFANNPDIKEKFEKYQNYNNKLNKYLQTSSDINIQLNALLLLPSDKFDLAKAKNILNDVIDLNSDKYTLFLADSICHNNTTLTKWCHQQEIHDIHLEVDPDNFETYKFLLIDIGKDEVRQDNFLLAAENSLYNNSYYYHYTIQIAESIAEFNKLNPEYNKEGVIFANPNMSEAFPNIDEENLKRKGLLTQDIEEATAETAPLIIAMGFSIAQVISNFEYMNMCQQTVNADSCLKIAEILTQDNSLMNKYYGQLIVSVNQTTHYQIN